MFLLYNSLTKEKQEFIPQNTKAVKMYVCGPTVYDAPHIGNARSIVVYDLLYRFLCYLYGKSNVIYVRNITDVDDKINAAAKNKGISIEELTSNITKIFHDNMKSLNCLTPSIEPKATEHISEMIKIIEILIAKNHAYVANHHVYFKVASDKNYANLAARKQHDMIAGARIDIDSHKKDAHDFVLWKPADAEDEPSAIFASPWGRGRPGWHIECSAMSHKYLGADFDIHGGGVDLIFPHHSNEIAQSTCAFEGSAYAKFWVHNGFLTVNKEKMSKSLGNFITVNELLAKGIAGEVIRYVLMSTHYRKPLDFNDHAILSAQKAIHSFYLAFSKASKISALALPSEVIAAFNNDLNIPQILALLHQYATKINKSNNQEEINHLASQLLVSAQMIGLLSLKPEDYLAPQNSNLEQEQIQKLMLERNEAKLAKNFKRSDEIRDYLASCNITIEDGVNGSIWRYKL
jgi:cysteinyl-tRNA synthetase